jgi:TRAP-type C4-dicarboxylate transport system permease small subunit
MTEEKKSSFAFFARLEEGVLMLILVGMVLLSFIQILLRNIFGIGLFWIDPLVRQMLLWVTLVGAMVATRDNNHITVDAISRYLPPGRIKFATGFICDTFATIVCALLTHSTFRVFHMEFQDPLGGYIMPGLPLWASLLTLPVAFGVMTLRFLRFSILSFLHTVKGEIKI